jgi:hypothetical protein
LKNKDNREEFPKKNEREQKNIGQLLGYSQEKNKETPKNFLQLAVILAVSVLLLLVTTITYRVRKNKIKN